MPAPADATRWTVPAGSAWFQPASRLWWRTGLDQPVMLARAELPRLAPTLGTAPVVVHLASPVVLAASPRTLLQVRWPVLWEVRAGDAIVDRFRPAMRATLLGPLGEGRLLDSALAHVLQDDAPIPEGWVGLRLVLHHAGGVAVTVRRIAFSEDGLTLARVTAGLIAGDVDVRVIDGDHALSSCTPADLPAGAEVLRMGDPRTTRPEAAGLRWWLDGTRRSMAFSL